MFVRPVKLSKSFFRLCLLFLFTVVGFSDQKAVPVNHRKLFHDLISGKGLYSSTDRVTILDNNNFNSSVIENRDKAWIVEFYNSWCGHCIRYSTVWKNFAKTIHNWRDIVAVAVVDCSADVNGQLCRDYEIMAYPTLRYFPPNSQFGFYGSEMARKFKLKELRHLTIETLEKSILDKEVGTSWPKLSTTDNLSGALADLPSSAQYVAVMFDSLKSYAGTELILDFHNVKDLKVFSVLDPNHEYVKKLDVKEFPSLYVKEKNAGEFIRLPVKNTTREDFYNATKLYLNKQRIYVADLEYVNEASEEVNPNQIYNIISEEKALSDDKVYQLDLEMALKYTLFRELRRRKVFEGETLSALKHFLRIIARYFPIDTAGKELLQEFNDAVWKHEGALTFEQYNQYIKPFESQTDSFFLSPAGYMNCASSIGKPPCSLWLMFHTLTVQAHSKHLEYSDFEPQDVLNGMLGYIKNFFGCTDCSQHFQTMAVTIPNQVTTFNSSILWLWNAHNQVNARLKNDSTENPARLKIQFPSSTNCEKCKRNGEWNEEEVLNHLKQIYSKISYHPLVTPSEPTKSEEQKPSHRLSDTISNDEIGYREEILISPSANFNLFDISLCVTLYVVSVMVLVLICIKFLVKRNNRKKFNYIYDILNSRV